MNDATRGILEFLWGWNPPVLIDMPRYRDSQEPVKSTLPSFYEKHIAEGLALKYVKHMPTLCDILLEQVDVHIQNAPTLPKSTTYLHTERDIEVRMDSVSVGVFNELMVANFYDGAVFSFCGNVASTLALHPGAKEWWRMLWHVRRSSQGPIAEATLEFRRKVEARPDAWESAKPAVRDAITYINDSTDWCVATVDHLSLNHGTRLMFEQLLGGARGNATPGKEPVEFYWTFCDVKENGRKCPSRKFFMETFYDDPTRLWAKHVNLKNDAKNASQGSLRGSERCSTKRHSKDTEPPFREPGEATIGHILQHSWVRAVKHNVTFILISGGNYEVIAIRDRERQTLYVSDLIEPSKYPGYMKLQVGLYITAMKDILARSESERAKRADTGGGGGGSDDNGGEKDGKDDKGVGGDSGGKSDDRSGDKGEGGQNRGGGAGRGAKRRANGSSQDTPEKRQKGLRDRRGKFDK